MSAATNGTKRLPDPTANVSSKKRRAPEVNGIIPTDPLDPLLVLAGPAAGQIIYNPSSPHLLSDLLSPLSRGEFLRQLFRKKAVHVSRSPKDAQLLIRHYMYGLDVRELMSNTSSDNVFVWLAGRETGDGGCSSSAIRSVEMPDVDTAHALHEVGHSTYCRAPPELEQTLVSAMLRDTGLGCGQYDPSGEMGAVLGRGEVEVFVASRSGNVTGWHTDFQENFTIQLSGVKRWTIKQGTVRHPLRGTTPHYRSPESVEGQLKAARLSNPGFEFGQPDNSNSFGEEKVVIMNPGDVLYFPAGMWHKVETIEAGVSINISLMATSYASLICQSLNHILHKDERFRASVAHVEDCGDGSGAPFSAVTALESLLPQLSDIVADFARRGGPRAILPPALLQPPNFQVIDRDEANNDQPEDAEEDKDAAEGGICEGKEEQDNESDDGSGSAMESEGKEPQIVDADIFSISNPLIPFESCTLERSPLATLIKMTSLTSYFANGDVSKDEEELFVLNVNYGGNDMHESSIRIAIRAKKSKEFLEDVCARESTNAPFARPQRESDVDEIVSAQSLLVYYGYLVPKPGSQPDDAD